MDIDKYISLILGIPKTIYINFKYLKLKDAIKLPIWVSRRVVLLNLKGKINITSPIKPGMIKIGFGNIGIFDKYKSRTILSIYDSGSITFNGKTNIGHGSKFSISGNLILGKKFTITAESSIICRKKIVFGNNCLLSWNILIMDSDEHKIKSLNGLRLNNNKEISIGNNIWIGCRCTILKGTTINDNNIIASSSILCSKYECSNSIIGGCPSRILKNNVCWEA